MLRRKAQTEILKQSGEICTEGAQGLAKSKSHIKNANQSQCRTSSEAERQREASSLKKRDQCNDVKTNEQFNKEVHTNNSSGCKKSKRETEKAASVATMLTTDSDCYHHAQGKHKGELRYEDDAFKNKRLGKGTDLEIDNADIIKSEKQIGRAKYTQKNKGVGPSLMGQSQSVNELLEKTDDEYLETFHKGRQLEALVLGTEEELGLTLKSDERMDLPTKTRVTSVVVRRPVWEDDEDTSSVDVIKDSRYCKLAKIGETKINNLQYQQRLKKRFEVVSGSQPAWADLDLKDSHRPMSDEDEEEKELSHKTGDYLSKSAKILPPNYLEYKPVTHANKSLLHKTSVSTIRFHPTSQVVMTAGKDQNLSFFQVDGVKNPKIQSMHVENYPIYCARFTTDGCQVILGSRHKAFYDYDMMSGQLMNVQPIKGLNNQPMSYFEMSPCGAYIAFRGEYGYVHILSTKSKELVCQLKMNGSVNSLCFSPDGSYLYTFGDDAEVYVWQMSSRQCIHRFRDEGCLNGTSICTDQQHKYLVCGSEMGVVNIYKSEDCMKSSDPKPIKDVNNLLTKCTTSAFNSSAQILALSSQNTEKSVKLVNMGSLSVYQNFPSLVDKMANPTDMDFSPNSGYLATGTNKGIVHMYRLQHYQSY